MSKLLGANWRTSLSGLIGVTAVVIATQPNLIAFLPDKVQQWVKGIAGLVAAISGAYFALNAKDKKVTGGTIQQKADGGIAAPPSPATPPSQSVIDTHAAQSAWEGLT